MASMCKNMQTYERTIFASFSITKSWDAKFVRKLEIVSNFEV
jgi:hypothetical protein